MQLFPIISKPVIYVLKSHQQLLALSENANVEPVAVT